MKKMLGEQRRQALISRLKQSDEPITGSELAKLANVSRQVVVNDMNLLKAKNEPILSTSQGYIYLHNEQQPLFERKIVCQHTAEQVTDELFAIVDCGATVQNVIVEHAVYGEITATIKVSNRYEVEQFVQQLTSQNVGMLSSLTDGTHIHVISAPTEQQLEHATQALRNKGFLVEY